MLLQSPRIQTALARNLASRLNEGIEGELTIGRVQLLPFKTLILRDVVLTDNDPLSTSFFEPRDTIARIGIATVSFSLKGLTSKEGIHLARVALRGGSFTLVREGPGQSNLKRILMTIAHPEGEVNHGEILGLCEDMCNQFSGTDFGDFELGDLLNTVLDALQNGNYKVDPFLTNLARGVIAIEGTVSTLSKKVNILNYFLSKVDMGSSFNLNLEHPEEMNPEIALKLLQLFNGVTDSSVKKAETLDMLQKNQITLHTDFAFEEKALETVNRITEYVIRGLIIVALIIGSTLLCTTTPIAEGNTTGAIVFRGVGIAGYIVSLFFAQRLYRNKKKNK